MVFLDARHNRMSFVFCRVHARTYNAELDVPGDFGSILLFEVRADDVGKRQAPIPGLRNAQQDFVYNTLPQETDCAGDSSIFAGD